MARYLLAASPLAGHVTPLLRIGADLRSRGHQVRLLTGAGYRDRLRHHGIDAAALPLSAHPRQCKHHRGPGFSPLVDRWRAGRADMDSVFVAPMAPQYRALRRELDRGDIDAVLCDVAYTGALPLLLTDGPRPPVLVCGVGPLTLSSADTPPFGTGWQPRAGFDYRHMTWAVHRLLFADITARVNAQLGALGARHAPVFLTDWPLLADRMLQLTVPRLEYPRRDLARSVLFTGPVLPRPGRAGRGLPPWLPSGRRHATIVHVTQGTWTNRDTGQLLRPTLDALAHRRDLMVVATTGRRGVTTIAGTIPANAYVTDYLPYAQLLPHVDVMITNGGYGGVHHALSHSIPLIVAAHSADKPEVAARVAYTGAGVALSGVRPGASAIADALDRVLTTPRYRRAAAALGRDINATSAHDTIAEVLTALAKDRARSVS
ncbi:MAG: glycosyltransferase [Mycobacteriaceae bacterium]|nr:glycosyltransferase [Mycobacteriaceae bacterium]